MREETNEVDPAAPKFLDHIAGIHCRVDPERAVIGRPIEVGDLLEVQDLLRDPIELCEVQKISNFLRITGPGSTDQPHTLSRLAPGTSIVV